MVTRMVDCAHLEPQIWVLHNEYRSSFEFEDGRSCSELSSSTYYNFYQQMKEVLRSSRKNPSAFPSICCEKLDASYNNSEVSPVKYYYFFIWPSRPRIIRVIWVSQSSRFSRHV